MIYALTQGRNAGELVTKTSIVITMAGEGSRFYKAGYKVPKFMIEVKGKTLFDWSMDSLSSIHDVDCYVFVVQKKHDAKSFIEEHTKHLTNIAIKILQIDRLTDGQATTAYLATKLLNGSSGLLIYNIDTYVEPPFDCVPIDKQYDGYIPCFKASGDHWSFAELNSEGDVKRVTEKQRISDNCSIGAYYFSSVNLYRELFKKYYSDESNLVRNEKYIAPMYNYLIKNGSKVGISLTNPEKVHVLGTPDELKLFAKGDQ